METVATKTIWTIDPTHSEVQFKVRHLMVSTVTGQFTKFDGRLETEGDDFTNAKVYFTTDIDSITTNNEQRDGHLKSADFFHAEEHPQMVFESTTMTKVGQERYELAGTMTIRGISKPIVLNVEYGGQMEDFYGNHKAGFEITGIIKRKEFGLMWDAVTEAGGVVVSDEVKLALSIQIIKQK